MKLPEYHYLIIGSGLFGSVFAHEAHKAGKRCLILEKRTHTGGNIYCSNIDGINVHQYGAHIFHTDNKNTWNYVNQLTEFNRYTNSPLAYFDNKLYSLPFNMNTFYQLWGVRTPDEARSKIEEQRALYPPRKPTRSTNIFRKRYHFYSRISIQRLQIISGPIR